MEMKGFFKGKTVVVTGASSGIGWALSLELANRGALVIAAARRKEKLNELASHSPLMILPFVCDITIESNCADLMTFANNQIFPLCGLINNAGIGMRALFHELEMDVFHRVMEVNFGGTVRCTHYALPSLIKHQGWLVGVSSVAGYIGLPGRSGYSASKFAMQGFLEVIRSENRRKGLHVLVACPGFTKSEIRKQALNKNGQIQEDSPRKEQKLMTAEFVAQQIADAMEKRKDELIIGKQGKVAVWFKKFFPYLTEILTYKNMAKEPGSPFE